MLYIMYKVSHIKNGAVKYIYVFNGKKNSPEAQNKLFLKNPTDKLFEGIFTPTELTTIREDNIQVRFIPERLHLDDTVEIIKKKLLLHLIDDLNVSFPELYFFIMQPEQFKATALYQNLTQNEKLDLTKSRFTQFLRNIDEIDVDTLPEKEIYTYDDILGLNLEQEPFTVAHPVGQKMVSLKDEYPYTVNPYYVDAYDTFLEKFADEIITTTNKNILMDYGAFLNNTLYLCLAEEVLTYAENLAETSTLKIYFPYLYQKEITTLEQLRTRKQEVLSETRAMLTPTFEKNIENVNLFYDIYQSRTEELNFKEVGIKSLILTIQQPIAFHLPLDNVFKLIHATQAVPLIKMNLSKKQENIYRLYADKMATNGKKIPYLDKGVIFKWDKVMGKNKSVSVYIEHYEEETGSVAPILCEFNSDGSIVIKANFNTSLAYDAINDLFRKEVNPIINIVRDYLAQDGYLLNNFVDLNKHDITNMEFSMNIEIESDIKLKKIVGCLTSMFNVINADLANGIMLRFKRVSNYNEMESQEALILDMSEPHLGYTDSDIVKVLQTNFQLSEKAAMEKYADVKRAQETMLAGNKKLKQNNNPGFLTTIVKQPFKNVVIINVSGLNHIGYLTTLYIYLDSLIRITQKQTSTKVTPAAIKRTCAGSKTADEKQVAEIIAHVEQPNIHMTIVAEELVFNKPGEEEEEEELDEDDLFARFGYADEEGDNHIEPLSLEEGEIPLKPLSLEEGDNPLEPLSLKGGVSPLEEGEEEGVVGESPLESPLEEEGVVGDSPLEEDRLETDITGQSLGNPSPFEKRMRKYDKKLFATDTGKKNFSSYATDCQMNRRRQPIVLTDEEKNKIDKEHPGSYSEAIKYGSDPSKQFWYICPRYWDLKNNTSLNEEEVDKSLVIPKNPPGKKVPPGKQIFEFNDYGTEHLKDKKYITHYPGFLKAPHEERGVCLPCCFKKWEGKQTGLRAQCTQDTTIVVPPGRKKKKAAEEIDEYILAPDKFPITQENRFGYLPIAVQKFLHTDNKKCQISEMNTNIRQDHECLLRHSVEIHHTQSFVACIADIWFEIYKTIHKEKVRPTVKRMKEIFSETLTIDNFVSLQNGNLLKLFYPQSDEREDLAKYAEVFSKSNSKLYKLADKTKPEQMNALIKIARAYTNFLAYLKDDTVEIDYEYLWDLICKPNPKLFPTGINLVIIELTRKDITDNVELICPSNHNASSFFDVKKSSILVLKIDNFYEPIYAYKTTADEISITRSFNMMYKDVLPNVKYVLELIQKSFNAKCAPLASMPTVYKFEQNIPVERLVHYLQLQNYTTEKYVMNYDSKIVGVVASNNQDQTRGFIPCYPSALPANATNLVYDAYVDTYEKTRDFLEKLYSKAKRQIPCKPYMKVIEDGLIVGILTMTNQFVEIKEPTQDTFGADLKIMKSVNYTAIDSVLSTSTSVDMERVNYIKKIQLETKFYNVFRNTARYLLGQYVNNDTRREIEEKTKSSQAYLKKLRSIETLLRALMKEAIVFHPYAEADLLKLDTVSNCYNNCQQKAYCQPSGGDMCALRIPETNLINNQRNDGFYYGKLADEIVRYSRIKTFIFNPKAILSFSQLKYNLRENEIILLQSLLTQDYFENIITAKVNPYIKQNTYDTTQPIVAQKYSNLENYAEPEPTAAAEPECVSTTKDHITSKYWQAIFPAKSQEQIYTTACSFAAILKIIRDYTQDSALTQNNIKEALFAEYQKIYSNQILQILRAQGKKLLAGQLLNRQLSLENMLLSEDYYATNLDIWLLAIHYKVPLVILSDTALLENNGRFLVAYKSAEQAYYFLKVSAVVQQVAPVYTLITSGDMKIPTDSLRSVEFQTALSSAPAGHGLLAFIENFSLTEANKRIKTIKLPKSRLAPAIPSVAAPASVAAAPAIPSVAAPVPAPTVPPPSASLAAAPSAPPAVKKFTGKIKLQVK